MLSRHFPRRARRKNITDNSLRPFPFRILVAWGRRATHVRLEKMWRNAANNFIKPPKINPLVTQIPVPDDLITSLTDLTLPATWYPTARCIGRKIIAHVGPTNAGKTYQAIERLKTANSGLYCGPLRLLAWEIAEKFNNSFDIPCSLITGQEVRNIEHAKHTACTVEMASTTRPVDIALIDEIQLLADPNRGWAFTRALLGIPCKELHVSGDPSVLQLLQQICDDTKETLEIIHHHRLSPLIVAKAPLESLEKLQTGSAVVAFSRRDVHSMRHEIERLTGQRCAMVYGALPPESRASQAMLFNKPRSGFNLLCASDAIGMGLNLNIRTVIFSRLSKFDGKEHRPLSVAEIKQIAGRAGRYGLRYGGTGGTVTTLDEGDYDALCNALQTESEEIKAAALFPRFDQLSSFAGVRPDDQQDLVSILDAFAKQASTSPHYFFANFEDVRTNAVMIRHLSLSLWESYVFAISPCDPTEAAVAQAMLTFATVFHQRRPVTPIVIQHPRPLRKAESSAELYQLESYHRV